MKERTLRKIRGWICLAMTLMLAMGCCIGAGAEASGKAAGPLSQILEAGEALLFYTDNVTLEGTAVFALDGEEPFKRAEARYVQDGDNSLWRLLLFTPWPEGERTTGFTVIANGRTIYAMEEYTPGVYRMGDDLEQRSVMRESSYTEQLLGMTKAIAPGLEALLAGGIQVRTEGEETVTEISLAEEEIPETVNSLMNLAAQLMIRRMFLIDYDKINWYEGSHLEDFPTVTAGILNCTARFRVTQVEATVCLDSDGAIQSAAGTVEVALETWDDGIHQLSVSFDGKASQYGESKVEAFDPEAWGVTLQGESWYDPSYDPSEPEGTGSSENWGLELFNRGPSIFEGWEPEPRNGEGVSLPIDESAFTERYQRIRKAEAALQEQYGIRPEMWSFFSRKVEEDGEKLTLTLTGMNHFSVALGSYTATVGPEGVETSWSHEGKDTGDGTFASNVWGLPQLEEMLRITKRDREVVAFYGEAMRVAEEEDPNYEMPFDDLLEFISDDMEAEAILAGCRYTPAEMGEIAKQAVRIAYSMDEKQAELLDFEDEMPEEHFFERDGKLIYQAWLTLNQGEYPVWSEKDGMYEVMINAGTGMVEDIIYEADLNGNG